ncbi:sugar phosphate isomerase/epimerase family protein [Paenibacillus sp. M.A.Huq-84]
MRSHGYEGLEIAPTRVWDKPYTLDHSDYLNFKGKVNRYSIRLVAMQSLLYREESLQLFSDEPTRQKMLTELEKRTILASKLGIKSLVFGLPKNRSYSGIEKQEAFEIAVEFFKQAGDMAVKYNTEFCIEANPVCYGTNFINFNNEALDLVREVNSEGFRLHLDTGTMIENKEDLSIIPSCIDYVSHVHISEPFLEMPISKDTHVAIGKELHKAGYTGFISIEMKRNPELNSVENINSTLLNVREWYS